MPFNISEIYGGVRALMNDQGNSQYTNTIQFEYLKIAYEELRQELENNSVPVTNKTSSTYTILTSQLDIGGSTGPALPVDFIEPLDVIERTAGTTDQFMLMGRLQFLPQGMVKTGFLRCWSYQNQSILFIGATGSVEVKLNYVGDPLISLVDENTQVRVINTANFLKYRTAGLCADFVGENPARAAACNGFAQMALDTLLNITIKSSQAIVTRRRPFRSRQNSGAGWF